MAKKKPQTRARWTPVKPKAKGRAFTPFRQPTSPPGGTYDPSLDSQEGAADRGLADLLADVGLGNQRDENDFQLALQRLQRRRDEGLADILRARTQSKEDYGRQVSELDRGYSRLATRQAEQARATGQARGGALVQAMRKRGENYAFDRQPLDTAQRRFEEQSAIQEGRFRTASEDEIGDVSREFQRAWEDRNAIQLPRAQRENVFFRQDLGAQRWHQAKLSSPDLIPTRPANERTVGGLTVRVGNRGKPLSQRTYTLPTGQRLDRGGFVSLVRRRRRAGNPVNFYA
jgi:hypothetical protein